MKLLTALILALLISAGAEASVQFSPKAGVIVLIGIEGNVLSLRTSKGGSPTEQKFNFQTEKPLNLVVDDFNFDGAVDLSAWSIDEGKGTFEVHRVFIFDLASSAFREISPSCGDEFLNLRVDHVNKALTSTYFHAGTPAICRSKPSTPK